MDRGAWQATVPGVAESDITEQALRIIPVRMMVREESPREGSVEKQKGHHLAQKAESTPSLGHLCPYFATPRLLCPWNSSGKNTGVGCHFLFQHMCHVSPLSYVCFQGRNYYLKLTV